MVEIITDLLHHYINPNNHDIYGSPHWPSYGSQYEPKKNYVYDWRSVSTEIDNFREDAINYGYTLADDLFIAY